MKIVECEQGDATWYGARLGRLTGSRIGDALTKLKNGGESATRRDMMIELAVERITQRPAEHYVSKPMERGIELEPLALASYELTTGRTLQRVGFVIHGAIEQAGYSPDSLIGDDGLCEAKCPLPSTHAMYLLGEKVPSIYEPQCMWGMACTGRDYCDFISFCPEFPDPLNLFVCRLLRDDNRIGEMEREAEIFLKEVEILTQRISGGLSAVLGRSLRENVIPKAIIPEMG